MSVSTSFISLISEDHCTSVTDNISSITAKKVNKLFNLSHHHGFTERFQASRKLVAKMACLRGFSGHGELDSYPKDVTCIEFDDDFILSICGANSRYQ